MIKNFLVLSTLIFNTLGSFAAPSPEEKASVVILGGGVGALTSALYLGRAGIEPLVIEGNIPGGLLTQSHSVQNWPGVMEIRGEELVGKMKAQAEASGTKFLSEEVVAVDLSKRPFVFTTRSLGEGKGGRTIVAESCIIAMGTTPNFLRVPGEKEYWGRGVTNCAVCDGSLYRDRVVGVVGGGDAAVLEALYLAGIAKEVHLFVRKDQLRANETKRIDDLLEKPNVKILYETEVASVEGDGAEVTGVTLQGGAFVPLDGLFLAIGSRPNSELFQNRLRLDDKGYIVLSKDQETSVDGVYAVGDIVDPVYKQAISASGAGAMAALQAQKFLMDHSKPLANLKKGKKYNSSQELASKVIEIDSLDQFQQELASGESLVVVDFYATWCGPCKQLSPRIEASASQLNGKVKFLKVNVDKMGDLSKTYKIRAMPTVILFDAKGAILERKVGAEQISNLLKQLEAGAINAVDF